MSDDTVIELARLLAEATRARRLAEAAAMDEIGDVDERLDAIAFQCKRADEARRLAEQRGDELEAAQAQIVELRAKLADTAASLTLQRERADHATAEMDRMQRARSQVLVGRAGDASRLEQELRVLREEVAAQNINAARERAEYQTKIDRIMRVFAGLLVDTANDNGVYVDLASIRASFNMARDIARGES